MGKLGRLRRGIMRIPKVSTKDLDKIGSTIKEIKECPYCTDLKKQIKECAESKGVKDNIRSVTTHLIKCSDCRNRVLMITECKKKGHRS